VEGASWKTLVGVGRCVALDLPGRGDNNVVGGATRRRSGAALPTGATVSATTPYTPWSAWSSIWPMVMPTSLLEEPWASPTDAEWCAPPARPRVFVIMTAAVNPFVNLAKRGMKQQQRNTTERREMYEQVVRHWAVASNVPVIFAENSGADLASIAAQVPPWRRERFEFLNVPRHVEQLPPKAKPDVGRLEAQTILIALNSSRLLATRCPHDLVFGVTGRYFVHDFEHLVHAKCIQNQSSATLPLTAMQNPVWGEPNPSARPPSSALPPPSRPRCMVGRCCPLRTSPSTSTATRPSAARSI
jgi:hypothetical protein